MIKKLLIAGAITLSIFFLNVTNSNNTKPNLFTSRRPQNYQISENKEPEYSVRFMIVTPCINGSECYEFNEEILQNAEDFYLNYEIGIEFERKYIQIEGDISIDYGPSSSITDGLALKMDLIRATEVDMPHILHAPMFVDTKLNSDSILGVANPYLELVVLRQQMIDTEDLDMETHVLIHEIGHIFGLPDIYHSASCNLMDGYSSYKTMFCQKLTPEQVTFMKETIEAHLM